MLELPCNALLAVARFADEKNFREHLRYVTLEATPHGARLSATDGHIMAMYQTATPYSGPALFLPAVETIKACKDWAKDLPIIVLNGAMLGNLRVTLGTGLKVQEYDRIIPTQTNGEPASYDADFIKRFRTAAADLGNRRPGLGLTIYPNGTACAIVRMTQDTGFLGLMMPYRGEDLSAGDHRPGWLCVPMPAEIAA